MKKKTCFLIVMIFSFTTVMNAQILDDGSIRIQRQCEDCDTPGDNDGDGYDDCDDLDCLLSTSNLQKPEFDSKSFDDDMCEPLSDLVFEILLTNPSFREDNNLKGRDEIEAEAKFLADCIVSAIVSVAIEYTIHWTILNIQEDQSYGFFDPTTAEKIFNDNLVEITTAAGLSCLEGANPFKLSNAQELILNAGSGFVEGFAISLANQYNDYADGNCGLDQILFDKLSWGDAFAQGGTDALISVITIAAASKLGPVLVRAFREKGALLENEIRDLLGDDVWDAIRRTFLKDIDIIRDRLKNHFEDNGLDDFWESFNADFGDDLEMLNWFDDDLERVHAYVVVNSSSSFRRNQEDLDIIANYLKSNPDDLDLLTEQFSEIRNPRKRQEFIEDLDEYLRVKDRTMQQRTDDLSIDPSNPGQPDLYEGELGSLIEEQFGFFKRDASGDGDFTSLSGPFRGQIIDVMGIPSSEISRHGNDLVNFLPSVDRHFLKVQSNAVDVLAIDIRAMNETQRQTLFNHIAMNWPNLQDKVTYIT